MFCPVCGKQSATDANFCSSCGAAAVTQPVAARARIVRPRSPRMIAGVCSGLAIHYGWDVALTRILVCVFTILTSGLGLLCYLAAWILVPEAPFAVPAVAVAYPVARPAAPPAPQGSYPQGQGTGTV